MSVLVRAALRLFRPFRPFSNSVKPDHHGPNHSPHFSCEPRIDHFAFSSIKSPPPRITILLTPARRISCIVPAILLNVTAPVAENEIVPSFIWPTTISAASRTLVLRSGTEPSRIVPSGSSVIRFDRCERECERTTKNAPTARTTTHTTASAHFPP